MKIEIAPRKILKDALTVWYQTGEEVDIVMDIKNLTFKENSIDVIYAYHVLDHLFPNEIIPAIENWKKCLKHKSSMFMIINDFEYICRKFVSGEVNMEFFNENFARPCHFTKESIVATLETIGFKEGTCKIWFTDIPDVYIKQDHELIISAEKYA